MRHQPTANHPSDAPIARTAAASSGRSAPLVAAAAVLLVFAMVAPVSAQSDDDRERSAATLENGRLEAALYVIRPAEDDRKPIELSVESVLKWQNSVNQTV